MCINRKDSEGHSSVKIFICILLIVGCIVGDTILQSLVQEGKRQQARMNLEHMKYCYLRSFENYGKEMALNICTSKVRTSHTGDVYALEQIQEGDSFKYKFIYENSKDTSVREQLFFTEESVGKYFVDWNSGKEAIDIISLGKDSTVGLNVSYNFDGSPEWIEWKFVPDETDKTPVILVQGIQSDEVIKHYNLYRWLVFGGTILVVLILLISNNINIRSMRNGINNN